MITAAQLDALEYADRHGTPIAVGMDFISDVRSLMARNVELEKFVSEITEIMQKPLDTVSY